MSGIAEAIISPLATTLGNVGLTALGRHWANEDWKEQQSILNAQAAQNQVAAPSRIVEGLERAGLNPALASTGTFQPAATPLAPKSQYNMQASPLELANTRLVQAQAEKTAAEATNVDIQNKRATDADISANAQFRSDLMAVIKNPESSDTDKRAAKMLLNTNDVFSLGSLEGTAKAQEFRKILSEVNRDTVVNKFVELVHKEKLHNESAKYLSQMDYWTLRRTVGEYYRIQQEILNLGIAADLDKAQIHKVTAETAQIIQDTDLATYHSVAKAFMDGHYAKGSLILFEKAAMAAAGMMPLTAVGTVGRLASGRSAPTTQKAFDRLRGTTPPKGVTGNNMF